MRRTLHHTVLFCWLPCLLLFCQSCVVQKLDHTPYSQSNYYRQTTATLNSLPAQSPEGDTLKVGWAKVNITPPVGTPLAGYGKRKGMKYTAVHDSVWVRTFAFDNGHTQAYFVTLDMLIAPMSMASELEQEYKKLNLKPEQIYLSATHTHTSFGGWGKKLAGRIMAGKYKKQVVAQTVQHIIQSIKLAQTDLQPARVGYGRAYASELVKNRLTGFAAARDTTIRFMKFEKENGSTAILCTFAAHPTLLPSMQPILSRDYPGEFVDELEKHVSFAAFSAGAVGSMNTVYKTDSFESTAETGKKLSNNVIEAAANTKTAYTYTLGYSQMPLTMPEPHWRIGNKKRFAPALFYTLFGNYKAYLSSLQVGNVVFLGVPADYSGEFMPQLEAQALKQNQQLILTSFNGGYVGYIIPDDHYNLKKYETRAMNFYGPQSGSYITYLLLQLLRHHR